MAIGCGGLKEFDKDSTELKRMFVQPSHRGNGVASRIVSELEHWAKETGFSRMVLETSKEMEDAVGLYEKLYYQRIPNFEPYENIETSYCFAKRIN